MVLPQIMTLRQQHSSGVRLMRTACRPPWQQRTVQDTLDQQLPLEELTDAQIVHLRNVAFLCEALPLCQPSAPKTHRPKPPKTHRPKVVRCGAVLRKEVKEVSVARFFHRAETIPKPARGRNSQAGAMRRLSLDETSIRSKQLSRMGTGQNAAMEPMPPPHRRHSTDVMQLAREHGSGSQTRVDVPANYLEGSLNAQSVVQLLEGTHMTQNDRLLQQC